jgi:hypothetical protein
VYGERARGARPSHASGREASARIDRIPRVLSRTIVATLILAACLQVARVVVAPVRGLQAEYFAGSFTGGAPTLQTIDEGPSTAMVHRRWMGAAPSAFSVRWFGYLTVERSGRYAFTISSDDGGVLTIDGARVVDNAGPHGLQTAEGSVDLERGPHAVLVEFTQAGGLFAFEWTMARAGARPQPVAGWRLTPQRATAGAVLAARALDVALVGLLAAAALALLCLLWLRRDVVSAHPRTATLALFALLAVVHTWPLATDLGHLTRHDNRDAILNEWIVAWVAHELPRAPWHLFDANIFYPERLTLAFSEPMIVQGVMALPLFWMGASVVLAYNLLLLAGLALTGWTTALVVRRWTGDWTSAVVAGCLFGFNAHALSRLPHLQTQHAEFLPLALYALDRVLTVPTVRRALALTAWFVLQSLTSIYLLVITAFALLASVLVRVGDLRRAPVAGTRALAVAALAAVAVLLPFLVPYWLVSRDLGLVRSLGDASNYAAAWSAYLTTPARVHAWWSAAFAANGNVLFPGALGLLLAGVAIVRGDAFRDRRARMCLALCVAGLALSFGAHLPGYSVLYAVMPLLHGIRATARFGLLVTCGVAMLAGFGVLHVRRAVPAAAWRAVSVVLVVWAAGESIAAPLGLTPFDGIPPVYARVPRDAGTVVVELPFHGPRSAQFHAHYMLASTANWQPLVNGYSGFQPPSFYENARALQLFPGDEAFARMRALGVTHVIVHADQMPEGTIAALEERTDLARVDAFGAIVVYRFGSGLSAGNISVR